MGSIGDREPHEKGKGGKTICRVRANGGMASNLVPKKTRQKEARTIQEQYGVPLPEFPTISKPGSEEKIFIMRMRLLRKEQLFHPDDFAEGDKDDDV